MAETHNGDPDGASRPIEVHAAVKPATCMTRNGLIATCFVCLLIAGTGRAHGLDPSKRLTQYRHSMWRVQDGFFPGSPVWVSQTADGYLWVGTWNGTFRFDGVRFVPWSPPASASNDTYLFVPAKSGGFWINDGLGLLRDGTMKIEFDHLRHNVTPAAGLRSCV